MRQSIIFFTLMFFWGGIMSSAVDGKPPQVGDVAPQFELPGSDGETYKLSDFQDDKVVVFAWFPKAFTGG